MVVIWWGMFEMVETPYYITEAVHETPTEHRVRDVGGLEALGHRVELRVDREPRRREQVEDGVRVASHLVRLPVAAHQDRVVPRAHGGRRAGAGADEHGEELGHVGVQVCGA